MNRHVRRRAIERRAWAASPGRPLVVSAVARRLNEAKLRARGLQVPAPLSQITNEDRRRFEALMLKAADALERPGGGNLIATELRSAAAELAPPAF